MAVAFAAAVVAQSLAVLADEVPTFDIGKSCKTSGSDQEIRKGCQGDERDARATLVSKWTQFTSASKQECVQLQGDGSGPQSYVELLTCLEMAKDTKSLPKD
jgi:hypothetical protein